MKRDWQVPPAARIVLVGVGNEIRGDDGTGLVLAREMARRAIAGVIVREVAGDALSLLEAWRGASTVLLFDAVSSGSAPGTIHRVEAHRQRLPSGFRPASTHALGIAEAIELARSLGELPPKVIVYGIEGKRFEAGEGLSPEVRRAVEDLVARVVEEVRA